MEPEFWRARWQAGEIGFHRAQVHPALERFWPEIGAAAANVLVPLCGKSLDLHWLARRGHAVTGVELERAAVEAFFTEASIAASERRRPDGLVAMQGNGVRLLIGDFLAYRPETTFDAFYDRAALVALPRPMRRNYLEQLAACCRPGARGLLVTFEYPDDSMDGPPFPVREDELRDQPWFTVERLARDDVTGTHPGLVERGASPLHEAVYRLERGDA